MMTREETKRLISWVKGDCEEFIRQVWDYMKKEDWTWFHTKGVPTRDDIMDFLFRLLDLMTETDYASSGGFIIRKDEKKKSITCSFGHSSEKKPSCILVKSLKKDEVLDFIFYLCEQNPVLDVNAVKKLYDEWKNIS